MNQQYDEATVHLEHARVGQFDFDIEIDRDRTRYRVTRATVVNARTGILRSGDVLPWGPYLWALVRRYSDDLDEAVSAEFGNSSTNGGTS